MNNNKIYPCNYAVAVSWMNNNYVLCNNLPNIDFSIVDNARFAMYDEESETEIEIYQYFITDASRSDVETLETFFPGLLFTYSDLLECFVLCVPHYGTSWNYVYHETTNEFSRCGLGVNKPDVMSGKRSLD